jgi:hypothetical protein
MTFIASMIQRVMGLAGGMTEPASSREGALHDSFVSSGIGVDAFAANPGPILIEANPVIGWDDAGISLAVAGRVHRWPAIVIERSPSRPTAG